MCMAFRGRTSTHMLCVRHCRNGNFTAPMSRNFRKVVGTEIAKESVKLANDNMAQNGCTRTRARIVANGYFQLLARDCVLRQVIMFRWSDCPQRISHWLSRVPRR
jgi:tRNA G37 N-methylase Trm5